MFGENVCRHCLMQICLATEYVDVERILKDCILIRLCRLVYASAELFGGLIMKKILMLIIGLVLLLSISCSNNGDKESFYNTYTFEEVSYLSLLSSSTIDYMNEQMAGTKYTIEADLFKIETSDKTVEIDSPSYIKEEIEDSILTPSDVYSAMGDDVKHQYTIYKKDGSKTYWRLYVSSGNVWVGSYVDNTANGSEKYVVELLRSY